MSFLLLFSDTVNTPVLRNVRKERWESPLAAEPQRLGSNAYSSREWNVYLNFIGLTTSLMLLWNSEQQWRQTITIRSSGHALKERTISLSSISFESIQMHIFYKTFQDWILRRNTQGKKKVQKTPFELKRNFSCPSLLMFTSGQYCGLPINMMVLFEALRHVELTSCLGPCVRAGDSPVGSWVLMPTSRDG